MKNTYRWIGVVAVGVMLLGTALALAADWPQWRGLNRNGMVKDFTAPADWSKDVTAGWKVTVGLGDGGPVMVGDKLFVFSREGTNEVTRCVNVADGKEAWKEVYEAPAISGADAGEHSGPRATPAVADGKIVTLGLWGVVTCRDAATGKQLWQKDPYPKATPRFHTASSPLIVDGLAIVQVGKDGGGAIMAFDLAKGDEKWKWDAEGPAYSSPVLQTVDGTKSVVAMTEKSIVGVALADGKLLWKVPFVVQGMAYNAATPVIDGSTVIYTGQARGTTAIKIEKKGDAFATTELWKSNVGTQYNTPILKDGFLYGLSDGAQLFCLDAKDGKTAWTQPVSGAAGGGGGGGGGGGMRGGMGASTRANSTAGVVQVSDSGLLLAGRGGGMGGGGGMRGNNFGEIVDAGSVLLALTSTGDLIVIKPAGAKYEEVARIKVGAGAYGYPVVAGKQIFVKDKDSLVQWMVK
jgi:outer membrane protein assembly factor BamB